MIALPVMGQSLRERLIERMKAKSVQTEADPAAIVPGARCLTLSYGADAAQALDVFIPPHAEGAPVLVMAHGGGWRLGDKTSPGVIDNKLKYWLPKGYILVSVNYRLLPTPVSEQAKDVAAAVAYVENHATEWGGDGSRLILMGHSAGAHLAALLSADPSRVTAAGGHAWRGTVVLDSAALDVASVMNKHHPKLYDDAFGKDPVYWANVSPAAQLKPDAVPMQLVCSLKRPDDSCGQSKAFAAKLQAIGQDAPVVPQELTHMQIDHDLGLPGAYTDAVDAFMVAHLR
ncbi:MAG TPA: alpha/beta hydrolase [Asticcacaulis sp.]|nr:alpha/beta hydrolase [Asticcacaulis sp.]